MKLKNKKTGESYEMTMPILFNIKTSGGGEHTVACESIKILNEEWEDVSEEPKEYWYVMSKGEIRCTGDEDTDFDNKHKEIGNYFDTREEAELALLKLRAYKRLKDKGFRFNGKEVFSEGLLEIDCVLPVLKGADNAERLKIIDDLDLLFSQEDD